MDNVITLQFIDELKIEGINYKGYGVIPKFVMLDSDLTIEAKGIYAYFCSYAGAGNTAFPSRDRILLDLPLGKDSYYKHFNVLTLQGYISVTQSHSGGGRGNGFSKNIYTLIANPKKFIDKPEDAKNNQAYVRIRFGGLSAAGFGFIPKAIMLDPRLDLKAKAIYAYFCSFAGSGNAAFPKISNILFHLGITEKTYYKYFRELQAGNYITPVQRYIDGRLSVNDYYLNNNPDVSITPSRAIISDITQSGKIPDTQDADEIQSGKKQYTQKQYTQKQYSKIQYTQNQDTNINNIKTNNTNINNDKINQSNNQQDEATPNSLPESALMDRVIDTEYKEIIKDELLREETLPYRYLSDEIKLTTAIHIMTMWDTGNDDSHYQGNDSSLQRSAFTLFNEALIEMLTEQQEPMKLKGVLVSYTKVYDRLKSYIKIIDSPYEGRAPSIFELQENAIGDFIAACGNTEIKNYLQYMKAVIWNALQVGSIAIDAAIKRDFG